MHLWKPAAWLDALAYNFLLRGFVYVEISSYIASFNAVLVTEPNDGLIEKFLRCLRVVPLLDRRWFMSQEQTF